MDRESRRHLEILVRLAGTQHGKIQNIPQILASLKIRQALRNSRMGAPEGVRARIDQLLANLDAFILNRGEIAAGAERELQDCVNALTSAIEKLEAKGADE